MPRTSLASPVGAISPAAALLPIGSAGEQGTARATLDMANNTDAGGPDLSLPPTFADALKHHLSHGEGDASDETSPPSQTLPLDGGNPDTASLPFLPPEMNAALARLQTAVPDAPAASASTPAAADSLTAATAKAEIFAAAGKLSPAATSEQASAANGETIASRRVRAAQTAEPSSTLSDAQRALTGAPFDRGSVSGKAGTLTSTQPEQVAVENRPPLAPATPALPPTDPSPFPSNLGTAAEKAASATSAPAGEANITASPIAATLGSSRTEAGARAAVPSTAPVMPASTARPNAPAAPGGQEPKSRVAMTTSGQIPAREGQASPTQSTTPAFGPLQADTPFDARPPTPAAGPDGLQKAVQFPAQAAMASSNPSPAQAPQPPAAMRASAQSVLQPATPAPVPAPPEAMPQAMPQPLPPAALVAQMAPHGVNAAQTPEPPVSRLPTSAYTEAGTAAQAAPAAMTTLAMPVAQRPAATSVHADTPTPSTLQPDSNTQALASAQGAFAQALNSLSAHTPQKPEQAPVQMQTPFGAPGWQDEVGNNLVWAAGHDQQKAELVLTPAHLGRIEISITVANDQASASFVSANPAVREALEQALPRLREMFANAGITLGDTNVGAESSAGGDGQRSGNPGRRASRLQAASAIATSAPGAQKALGLVDTFA